MPYWNRPFVHPVQRAVLAWTCTWGEQTPPPLQLFIIYHGGGRISPCSCKVALATLHPYGVRIFFPLKLFSLSPAKCSQGYYFCWELFLERAWRRSPRTLPSASGASLRCGRAGGVCPPPSSPLPSPPTSPLARSKERGRKRKHHHLLGFLSLQLGACLINIIWAGSAQCFLRHLF